MFYTRKLIERTKAALAKPGSLGATLIKGAAGTAGIKAAHAAIAFATSVAMAKLLGPAGYGVFSYALALVALLSIPSELGVPNLAVREIAVANARKNWAQMKGFIVWAHTTVAITSAALMVIGSAVLLTWGHHLTPSKAACLWLVGRGDTRKKLYAVSGWN